MNNLLAYSVILNVLLAVSCVCFLMSSNREDGKLDGDIRYSSDVIKTPKNGIYLGGAKYFFDPGEGELSSVLDDKGMEVVPQGAYIVAMREDYVIGAWEGSVQIGLPQKKIETLEKVFFVIQNESKLVFHYPNPSAPKFIGGKIKGEVQFLNPAERSILEDLNK